MHSMINFSTTQQRRAFTLIELLVALSILAVLAAILFPVFARARESARRANCLSNLKQVGMAFMQYAQDYDERYPLSSYRATAAEENVSWTVTAQPYMKSIQMFRCPSDEGVRWLDVASPAKGHNYFTTSYIMNVWIAGASRYASMASVNAPSQFIIVADANTGLDELRRDHFHPYFWINNDPEMPPNPFMHAQTWDGAKNETRELALRRHLEAFNALYGDGHVKVARWNDVWWQDISRGVYEGNFDPRQ